MTTHTFTRRDLLGTTAKGLAALTALSGGAIFATSRAGAAKANACIANHQHLAQNLKVLTLSPDVGEREKAMALKTCRCVHCDVAISPML